MLRVGPWGLGEGLDLLVPRMEARRSFTQSVNLIAHSDFSAADVQQAIEDLGQFLLDNSADLSNGLFDS
jgi:hypothetical protein